MTQLFNSPEDNTPCRADIAAQGKCLAVYSVRAMSGTSANPAHQLSRLSFSLKER